MAEKEAPITPVDIVEQLCATLEKTIASIRDKVVIDERDLAILEEAEGVLDGSRVWLDTQYC